MATRCYALSDLSVGTAISGCQKSRQPSSIHRRQHIQGFRCISFFRSFLLLLSLSLSPLPVLFLFSNTQEYHLPPTFFFFFKEYGEGQQCAWWLEDFTEPKHPRKNTLIDAMNYCRSGGKKYEHFSLFGINDPYKKLCKQCSIRNIYPRKKETLDCPLLHAILTHDSTFQSSTQHTRRRIVWSALCKHSTLLQFLATPAPCIHAIIPAINNTDFQRSDLIHNVLLGEALFAEHVKLDIWSLSDCYCFFAQNQVIIVKVK